MSTAVIGTLAYGIVTVITILLSCLVAHCSLYMLSFLLVALPLTSDTLLPLLKEVKNWRKLAKGLIWAYDRDDRWGKYQGYENLDILQHLYGSDEECLKTVIEKFTQGKGDRYRQPSWRAVLQSLCNAKEVQLASSIKSYAEPLQGACIVDVHYSYMGR